MREEYIEQLEKLEPAVVKAVGEGRGLTQAELRAKLEQVPALDLDLLGPAIVKLWDAGKVEVQSDRRIVIGK